jgi:release factor glutamine methyltransferase
MTVHDILNETTKALEKADIPSARLDAEVLLAYVLGCERLEFFKNPQRIISEEEQSAFQKLIERRLKAEPVAYIRSRKDFWSFTLEVDKNVLIPRPDTEVIVEEAITVSKKLDSAVLRILDIGTGSGAIALALAREIPHAKIVATDISAAALEVAKKNARNLGLDSLIEFRQADLFKGVDGLFDIIVSNPPYIAADEYESLPAGVKDYEPQEALLAGVRGTEFYEQIINQAAGYVKSGGWLLLEIGSTQAEDLKEIVRAEGKYQDIGIRNDYAGRPRVVKARRIN